MSGVIDINVAKRNKYGSQLCNKGHLTFIFEFDLAILKITMHDRKEILDQGIQQLSC